MLWCSMIMTAREFSEFRRDLEREYREEIAAGKAAGYTFFSCKQEKDDLLLLHIPPGAVVLFERMPDWLGRLKPYKGNPDLKGFKPVSVCWGGDG